MAVNKRDPLFVFIERIVYLCDKYELIDSVSGHSDHDRSLLFTYGDINGNDTTNIKGKINVPLPPHGFVLPDDRYNLVLFPTKHQGDKLIIQIYDSVTGEITYIDDPELKLCIGALAKRVEAETELTQTAFDKRIGNFRVEGDLHTSDQYDYHTGKKESNISNHGILNFRIHKNVSRLM